MARSPRVCAAIAGDPVEHSLTPELFKLVSRNLEEKGHKITFESCEKVTFSNIIDAMGQSHALKRALSKEGEGMAVGIREIWLSLTTPLKHQLPFDSGAIWTIGDPMLASVNQLRHDGHVWRAANTDGPGLLMVAREFGFNFELPDAIDRPLLCMIGGGSTARACAAAWADAGGKIWWKGGRRALSNRGPWVSALVTNRDVCDHFGRRLHVDFDVEPGSEPTVEGELIAEEPDAPLILSASYSSTKSELIVVNEWGIHLDGRWLLVAQHLEAWTHLFFPQVAEDLPSLRELVNQLNSKEEGTK